MWATRSPKSLCAARGRENSDLVELGYLCVASATPLAFATVWARAASFSYHPNKMPKKKELDGTPVFFSQTSLDTDDWDQSCQLCIVASCWQLPTFSKSADAFYIGARKLFIFSLSREMFGASTAKGEQTASIFGSSESSSGENGGNNMNIPGFQDEPACAEYCPKLTYGQRIMGFLGCTGFGYLLSLMGSLVLFGGFSDENIRLFITLYVLGNVLSIISSGFLSGPKQQCIKMWDPTRRYSTAFYLAMLIVVFAVAVAKQNIFLILFLLFIQYCAGIWYAASFIPFGRKMILGCLKSTICKPCWDTYESTQKK